MLNGYKYFALRDQYHRPGEVTEFTEEESPIEYNLEFNQESNLIPIYCNAIQQATIFSPKRVDTNYRDIYIARIAKDADVHYNRIAFNSGDVVFIRRFFDTNRSPRSDKINSF
ncbi:hypothetical protein CWI38_0230p0020 [Hamiltosporidium tvaerminnensis]|uniref:Uncharacterized protein n=1 Tax=Hamiltosporidium tvaerminnensis TaxID=1176355 RepID=A0A4Q9LZF4_9MICR|nr:hypothetical protein CWI38_0230p0020 [Hamiltosporidium tvaerminnensis]